MNAAIEPSVGRYAKRIRTGGTVLDIACGGGRHALYLAARGYRVTAVDIDISHITGRIDTMPDLAQRIEIIAADLEDGDWPFAALQFDGIVVTNYLHRPHFPLLADSLTNGGVLIFDTFAAGNEKYGRPRNPDYLLEPGELLDAFSPPLTVVAYAHGWTETPVPAVRQHLCGINAAAHDAVTDDRP